MRIALLSDFHFTQLTWNPFRLFSKRLLGNLNWCIRRKKQFFPKQLTPLVSLFSSLDIDHVLIAGDFSTTALIEEFEQAHQFVKQIQQPTLFVPGNHDHYTYRSYREKHFYRFFSNRASSLFPYNLKEHQIEVHALDAEHLLIALDTAIATSPYSSAGLFSKELEARLTTILNSIPPSYQLILLNHYPFFQNDLARHNLKRAEPLRRILEKDRRIQLYLHGHTHRRTIADVQLSQLPIVLDGGSAAMGTRGSWLCIDVHPTGCSVTPYGWDGDWKAEKKENFAWKR